jgi:putative DNA methylase
MSYHERRLPHYYPPEAILFLTWRLFGSLPAFRSPGPPNADPGKAFAQNDHLLDSATSGPLWFKDHRIAALVARALDQGENEYHLYQRFAWVIMPNHMHVVMQPFQPLPVIMRWIKGSTARSANLLLEGTVNPFWQYETYDHCVRTTDELNRVIRYVGRNPVRAGFSRTIEDWPWSSASAGRGPTPQGIVSTSGRLGE